MLKDRITEAMKEAMRERRAEELGTLRLMTAAIKDREIAARGEGKGEELSDAEVLAVLGKMIKQRQDSARAYEEAGRLELADKERAEIAVIERFLPRQLDEAEMRKAIEEAIAATEAESVRDMGRVMGHLKQRYAGQMDFAQAGSLVREALTG